MLTQTELLAKAQKPAQDALRLHPLYQGKIQMMLKCPVRNLDDFAIWYTPGVAAPCKAIQADSALVYEHTNKANSIAVVTDGTRVLGLGDIGPEAALPVMEGKALLFKYLGGVDAVPICLRTKEPDEIIRTVKVLEPAFGAINLEDISQPKCFHILDTLRAEMNIPVWHDDHFDLVFCESVLNFVTDKPQAISELVRVTKPGGYVGINEMFWMAEPPVALVPQVQAILGTDQPLPTASAWQALWEASGLREHVVRIHPVDPGQEVKDRIQWIGWRWMVRAWGRALRLYLTNPAVRQAIMAQFDFPLEVMQQMGYGLFVGRK